MITRALVVVASGALLAAGIAGAEGPVLEALVGPGFNIEVTSGGTRVTKLDPGPYELRVNDVSAEHNFHLRGPGVDVSTDVEEVERKTFQLTLQNGTYSFVCDPHAGIMKGTFTVGDVAEPPPPPPPAPKPSAPVGARLLLTSGPGFSITLKTVAGKKVTRLKPGRYTIVARDRSSAHNARILGAGLKTRATSVAKTGTVTWKVVLKKGTLVFQCDPHKGSMRGTVKVAA